MQTETPVAPSARYSLEPYLTGTCYKRSSGVIMTTRLRRVQFLRTAVSCLLILTVAAAPYLQTYGNTPPPEGNDVSCCGGECACRAAADDETSGNGEPSCACDVSEGGPEAEAPLEADLPPLRNIDAAETADRGTFILCSDIRNTVSSSLAPDVCGRDSPLYLLHAALLI